MCIMPSLSEEKLKMLNNNIYEISGNLNLAYEIRSFIPEVLCELVFSNVRYSDSVSIIKLWNESYLM